MISLSFFLHLLRAVVFGDDRSILLLARWLQYVGAVKIKSVLMPVLLVLGASSFMYCASGFSLCAPFVFFFPFPSLLQFTETVVTGGLLASLPSVCFPHVTVHCTLSWSTSPDIATIYMLAVSLPYVLYMISSWYMIVQFIGILILCSRLWLTTGATVAEVWVCCGSGMNQRICFCPVIRKGQLWTWSDFTLSTRRAFEDGSFSTSLQRLSDLAIRVFSCTSFWIGCIWQTRRPSRIKTVLRSAIDTCQAETTLNLLLCHHRRVPSTTSRFRRTGRLSLTAAACWWSLPRRFLLSTLTLSYRMKVVHKLSGTLPLISTW